MTWLGQAGFLIKGYRQRILIDPFFSPHELRLHEPADFAPLTSQLNWLLVTHQHGDHFDVAAIDRILRRAPGATLVVPTPMLALGQAQLPGVSARGVQPGDRIVSDDLIITSVPAVHGLELGDGYSEGRPGPEGLTPFSGYHIQFPTLSLYHSGDTVVGPELIEFLEQRRPEIVFLPINGRDYFREERGWIGNLSPREAVELAGRIGARVLIPMHHDMIRNNTERPGAPADLAADLQIDVHVLSLARGMEFRF